MRVRLERQLAATVGASDPWPLDGDAPAAERHLPRRMAMADGSAAGIVLALRPDDLIDFLFHQLGEHAQPDTDAQREQALLRSADQLPERLLHARRQHDFVHAGLRERYLPRRFLLLILDGSPRTLSTRADEAGRTAVKFYELRMS